MVSEETDRALRTFLAQIGGKKGDLSNFVEEAVRDKLFTMTVNRIKERNGGLDQQDIRHTGVRCPAPIPQTR